ncbi:MAG: helix-turn-helix domain-containing protein [Microbacterium sp.]
MARAADLLRLAREESGLTQTALAQLSGIPQSVISEYETGRREPSFGAVDRLISAAGLDLEVSPRPSRRSTLDRLRAASDELHRALAPLGATRIRVFGSVARGDDTPHSDIDLVVDVPPETGLFTLLQMRREAEAVLGRRVDLVPSDGLKSAVAEGLEREAILL